MALAFVPGSPDRTVGPQQQPCTSQQLDAACLGAPLTPDAEDKLQFTITLPPNVLGDLDVRLCYSNTSVFNRGWRKPEDIIKVGRLGACTNFLLAVPSAWSWWWEVL